MKDEAAIAGGAARPRVLCLGRFYCDLVFTGIEALPSLGEERFARDLDLVPGGGAFITAAHLSALGVEVSLVSRLGIDPVSRALEPVLHASGIDLAWLERAADAGPQLTVAMVAGGDRAFLSRRVGGARPATLSAALFAPQARHLHIAEYATLAEIPDLVRDAKAADLTVSLDPSWDDRLIRSPDLLRTCAGVDLFLPNASEAVAISGAASLDRALDRLCVHFPVVVIKDGENGARLASGDERITMPAPGGIDVVDTTGAGDAFDAGFIACWIAGAPAAECLANAIACGSLSVEAVGGAGTAGGRGRRGSLVAELMSRVHEKA